MYIPKQKLFQTANEKVAIDFNILSYLSELVKNIVYAKKILDR